MRPPLTCLRYPATTTPRFTSLSSSPLSSRRSSSNLSTSLSTLKASQLKQLAIAVGAPVSGTKPNLIEGIEECVTSSPADANSVQGRNGNKEMRILSLDMGIRNLAYAFLVVPPPPPSQTPQPPSDLSTVQLEGWKRISITSSPSLSSPPLTTNPAPTTLTKETFTPSTLAPYAYTWSAHLLSTFRPTHILIERQRFRSGGSPAVLEWTLRVGVLEGMMHAILHTLARERNLAGSSALAVDPGRVARYWLGVDETTTKAKEKRTAREVKGLKIGVVATLLRQDSKRGRALVVKAKGEEQERLVDAFLASVDQSADGGLATAEDPASEQGKRGGRGGGRKRTSRKEKLELGMDKVDDLADALLMGVTWVRWMEARRALSDRSPAAGVERVLGMYDN